MPIDQEGRKGGEDQGYENKKDISILKTSNQSPRTKRDFLEKNSKYRNTYIEEKGMEDGVRNRRTSYLIV